MGETAQARFMEDKEKEADKTAVQDSAEETKKTEATEEVVIDYDKELQEEVEKFERAEHNKDGYAKRKAKEDEGEEADKTNDIEAQVAAALAKEVPKWLPKLQSTLAEDTVENVLNDLSQGNESRKKLIRFHFENSVGANGTIRERLENAALIADKKAIQKKQTEMATALKNRGGLGASGLGSSTEGQEVSDNILSATQIADLKARPGWDDKKIERFKKNLRR